jgi:ribosomal protein S18 acetylase RimI-like enzyme
MPRDVQSSHAMRRAAVVGEVLIRLCRAEDLPQLEWFGMYTHHREILQDAFARHLRGDQVMLVADLNDFPVGQAWLDLVKRSAEGVGYIWAVRVFPLLRNLGIGRQLMSCAEDVLRERGFGVAEVGVEKDNLDAQRLYERLGYTIHRALKEEYGYTTPAGERGWHVVDQWIMRKRLDVQRSEPG